MHKFIHDDSMENINGFPFPFAIESVSLFFFSFSFFFESHTLENYNLIGDNECLCSYQHCFSSQCNSSARKCWWSLTRRRYIIVCIVLWMKYFYAFELIIMNFGWFSIDFSPWMLFTSATVFIPLLINDYVSKREENEFP